VSEWQIALFFIGTLIGGFCVGYMWAYRETAFWRVQWIKREHDLARLENRKPINIEKVKT
jgi:hypothetical protein